MYDDPDESDDVSHDIRYDDHECCQCKTYCGSIKEKADITNPEQPDYDVTDGSIRFDHVTFRYNKQSEKPVLDDIELSRSKPERPSVSWVVPVAPRPVW